MIENNQIKILFVEDLLTDFELAVRVIKKENIDFAYRLVDEEKEFREALTEFEPDIVVSDYIMPTFDGMKALQITRTLNEFIPFIILTGSMNEETAVTCMKAGANDYVLKEKIKRLPFAILEALAQSKIRNEKTQIEGQLSLSEQKYRSLIEKSVDAVYLLYNRKFEIINPAFEAMFGYALEEVNQPDFDFINLVAPESKNYIEARLKKIRAGIPMDLHYEFTAVTKSGDKKDVEASVAYIDYQGGKAVQGIIRDITERKATEKRLKLLSRAIEQNPVAIEITDNKGIIEYINPAFEQITGYAPDEILGKSSRLLKSGYHQKEFYEKLWKTILSGKDWVGELRNKKKTGELYWENASISPIVNDKGDITHFVAVKEDITEKKKMIADLIAAKERAEESDSLKSSFLTNLSHEVRTPLNGILGFTALLRKPNLTTKETDKYVNIIEQSGDALLNTIHNILELSQLHSNQITVKPAVFSLNEMLGHALEKHNNIFNKTDITWELNNKINDQNIYIDTDQSLLLTTLGHIIKNAAKYTQSGSVQLIADRSEKGLELKVKDTGVGIPESSKDKIFASFVQADMSTKRIHEGPGIGLTISKGYIELLGGQIEVWSEEQKGSEFTLVLPDEIIVESETKKPADESTHQAANDKVALVVEDDKISFKYLEILLLELGFNTLQAKDGFDAIRVYEQNSDIDLIVMDINLPGQDGLTTTKLIRRLNKQVPIIAQTAYTDEFNKEEAQKAGCSDFLNKPVDKSDLESSIRKFLSL